MQPEEDSDKERSLYLEGIRLFNEKDYFEAHETWEEAWRMTTGPRARFYQGLIQAAVVLVHMTRENPRGVQRVWTTMLTKFEGLPKVYLGLEIESFVRGIEKVVAGVLAMQVRQGQQAHEVKIEWRPDDVAEIRLRPDAFE